MVLQDSVLPVRRICVDGIPQLRTGAVDVIQEGCALACSQPVKTQIKRQSCGSQHAGIGRVELIFSTRFELKVAPCTMNKVNCISQGGGISRGDVFCQPY